MLQKRSVWIATVCVIMLSLLIATVAKPPDDISPEASVAPAPPTEAGQPDKILVLLDGTITEMDLDAYLVGVILCEIPAGFHPQAKMAQAVVARTYALRTAEKGVKHGPGVVCGDPNCCQGYISAEEYIQKWAVSEPVSLAWEAVRQTRGRVITWMGDYIDATYFSCSGGRTEAAVAVWGAEVPYLQATDSPGEEGADHYIETKLFSLEDFCNKLSVGIPAAGSEAISFISYTQGGGVDTAIICDKTFTGTQLRDRLGLRSTCLSFSFVNDRVIITAKGFGHRVGMSQYGAEAMAQGGSSWQEILHHYYRGVTIE